MLTANRALAVGVGGTVAVGIADLALSDADQVTDSTLVWTLETPPAAGDWLLDGAALVAGGGSPRPTSPPAGSATATAAGRRPATPSACASATG